VLRAAFFNPAELKAPQTLGRVTQEAARQFARIAENLRLAGHDPLDMAHFLIRLLPGRLFTRPVEKRRPEWLAHAYRRLHEAVLAAYGWPAEISDEAILERLLALNLERAGRGD
jgi:hypothetical protein